MESSPRPVLEGIDPGTVPGRGWDLGPVCEMRLAQSHCWGLGDIPVQDEVVAPDGLWLSVRIWLVVVLG